MLCFTLPVATALRDAEKCEYNRQVKEAFHDAAMKQVQVQQLEAAIAARSTLSAAAEDELRANLAVARESEAALQQRLAATESELAQQLHIDQQLVSDFQAQRDDCVAKGLQVAELHAKVELLEAQLERMAQAAVGQSGSKDAEIDDHVRTLSAQRMQDYKSFEEKLVDKSRRLAEAATQREMAVSDALKHEARALELKAALSDAQAQLSVLTGKVVFSAEEVDLLELQQQVRELDSALELAQHDSVSDRARIDRLEEESVQLRQELEVAHDTATQLVQAQCDLAQQGVEISNLRDQLKGGKVSSHVPATSGNMSSISQKDLEKLKQRLEATDAKVKQASQDRAAWLAEKAQSDNQIKKLTKSNQLLEKESEKSKGILNVKQELTAALKAMEKQFQQASKSADKLQADIAAVQLDRDQCHAIAEQRAADVIALQVQQAADRDMWQQTSAKFSAETERLEASLKQCEDARQTLDKDFRVTLEELKHVKAAHESMLEEFESMTSELLALRETEAALQSRLDESQDSYADLKAVVLKLEANLEQSELLRKTVEDELSSRIASMSVSLDDAQSVRSDLERTVADTNVELAKLQELIRAGNQQIEQYALDLSSEQNVGSELRMRIQLLEMQKHESDTQKQDQAASLRSAELELSTCQAQLYDIRAKMELVSEKGGALQLQNAELESTNARLLQRVQESNELTARLQQQLNSSCDQAMEWHEQRIVLQKQVSGLQTDLKSTQLALSEMTAAHADIDMQLRATASQLEAERGAHGGTTESLQSVQSQLDYVKRNSDAMRAQTQDALKRARDAEESCEEMASQFASLRDDVKHKSQQASDAKLAMERAQRSSSDSLFALQQDCGKLEGECQVLRERARDLEEQGVKQKAQIHELAAKLAAARKAESSARAQAETYRAHADLSLPSPSSSSIATASWSSSTPSNGVNVPAGAAATAGLQSNAVLPEAQHAGRGESSASADRASILGNLANGLTEEAQKRILSRLVMATRKVYRSGNKAMPRQDASEAAVDEAAAESKENIQP